MHTLHTFIALLYRTVVVGAEANFVIILTIHDGNVVVIILRH